MDSEEFVEIFPVGTQITDCATPPSGSKLEDVDYVTVDELEKWSSVKSSNMCHDTIHNTPKFPVNKSINSKIFLCKPQQYPYLKVDAIVYRAPNKCCALSEEILREAGSNFLENLTEKSILKSNEVHVITKHNLVGADLIFCIAGVDKFQTVLQRERAVSRVYKDVLCEVVKDEYSINSVAICGLYPLNDVNPNAIHSPFRVLRTILQKPLCDNLKQIIVCPSADEMEAIHEVLPYYFPRNRNEEKLAFYLDEVQEYNLWGEVIDHEKEFKVLPRVGISDDSDCYGNGRSLVDGDEGTNSMSQFINPDGGPTDEKKNSQKKIRKIDGQAYGRLLIEAKRNLPFDRPLFGNFIQPCGSSKDGTQLVTIIGEYLPFGHPEMVKKAFLHFINIMDDISNDKYMLIYFCSQQKKAPSHEACTEMFSNLHEKYRQNLVGILMVHSSLMIRIWTWMFTTFKIVDLKNKISFINGLQTLDEMVDINSLNLPPVIYEREAARNSTKPILARISTKNKRNDHEHF